jgi:hypothetical protein
MRGPKVAAPAVVFDGQMELLGHRRLAVDRAQELHPLLMTGSYCLGGGAVFMGQSGPGAVRRSSTSRVPQWDSFFSVR